MAAGVQAAAPRRTWRRAYLSLLAAWTAIAGAGLVLAYLGATGSGSGSAATGSVALTVNGPPATRSCSYSLLVPGDLAGTATCALSISYAGSLSAWVSLTVMVQSRSGSGGRALYDGSNSTGLTLAISDGTNSYTVPAAPAYSGTTGGTCPTGYTCWTAPNDLAAWYGGTGTSLAFASGNGVTWTVTPRFPSGAGNPYQGGAAVLTLTAAAVQTAANPLPGGCTTATVGRPCPAAGSFTWS